MKRNKSLKIGDAVRVNWMDSYTTPGWRDIEHTPVPYHIVTQGFVTANTKKLLGVTHTISVTGGTLDPIHMPWVAIKGVTKLGKRWDR